MARRQRKYPQLPLHAEIERVAFGYVLSGKPYLARDIRNAVVSALNVAPENLALLHANTSGLALDNRVARVMQDFTQKGIHTGPNGGEHKNAHELYYPTRYGLELARRSTERRHTLLPISSAGHPEDGVSATRSGIAREPEGDLHTLTPPGSAGCLQVEETALRFVRDQRVIDRVVDGAHGACEVCNQGCSTLYTSGGQG
jgi:hypothetical protein